MLKWLMNRCSRNTDFRNKYIGAFLGSVWRQLIKLWKYKICISNLIILHYECPVNISLKFKDFISVFFLVRIFLDASSFYGQEI